MAQGPYSKLYHVLMDEYPAVWNSDVLLGAYVRLLVIADKWWPQVAQKPAGVSRYAFNLLIEAGLVAAASHRNGYSIRGLDKERSDRSEHAKHAASSRWRDAASNAASNAQAMPSKVEQSKVEHIDARSTNGAPQSFMGWKPRAAIDKEAERRAIERMQSETDEELYRRHPELRPKPSPGTSSSTDTRG